MYDLREKHRLEQALFYLEKYGSDELAVDALVRAVADARGRMKTAPEDTRDNLHVIILELIEALRGLAMIRSWTRIAGKSLSPLAFFVDYRECGCLHYYAVFTDRDEACAFASTESSAFNNAPERAVDGRVREYIVTP